MDDKGFIPVVRPSARQYQNTRNVIEEVRDQNPFESLQELQGGPTSELQKERFPPNDQNL